MRARVPCAMRSGIIKLNVILVVVWLCLVMWYVDGG